MFSGDDDFGDEITSPNPDVDGGETAEEIRERLDDKGGDTSGHSEPVESCPLCGQDPTPADQGEHAAALEELENVHFAVVRGLTLCGLQAGRPEDELAVADSDAVSCGACRKALAVRS